ncbi:MAG: helix-turn-helix domain-containing protein [Bacteroidota bacterium]
MTIETFYPRNEELKEYIESFYVLEHSEDEPAITYLTFPSVYSIVAALINGENVVSEDKIVSIESRSKTFDTSLVCRFNKPLCFEYHGNLKEICLYFKPLGLNAFLSQDLSNYSKTSFDEFAPFDDYKTEITALLDKNQKSKLGDNLENYWLSKLTGFNHPFMKDAVAKIDGNIKTTTFQLAKEFNVSQKTLISEFKKHLCKTPSEYKKILRFRRTLDEMNRSAHKTSLTELTHLIEFFDQSHMIANFKSLTGLTPKAFFKDLSSLENSNIHWIFS